MNSLLQRPWRGAAAVAGGAVSLLAGEPAEKAGYTLANPVPAGLLRELSTDRPDATESPFTVDAGHVQVEVDVVTLARDESAGVERRAWAVLPLNVRIGVSQQAEVGFFATPWIRERETPGRTRSGAGDLTSRGKYNWQGNDTEETGVGLIVDVKAPTATGGLGNGHWEGAIFWPVALGLGNEWELGAMTGGEWRYTDAAEYRAVWVNSMVLERGITGSVSVYVELTSELGDGGAANTFDTGVSWRAGKNIQFDAGVETGLSRHADDLVLFVGVTRRY